MLSKRLLVLSITILLVFHFDQSLSAPASAFTPTECQLEDTVDSLVGMFNPALGLVAS